MQQHPKFFNALNMQIENFMVLTAKILFFFNGHSCAMILSEFFLLSCDLDTSYPVKVESVDIDSNTVVSRMKEGK